MKQCRHYFRKLPNCPGFKNLALLFLTPFISEGAKSSSLLRLKLKACESYRIKIHGISLASVLLPSTEIEPVSFPARLRHLTKPRFDLGCGEKEKIDRYTGKDSRNILSIRSYVDLRIKGLDAKDTRKSISNQVIKAKTLTVQPYFPINMEHIRYNASLLF